MKRFMVTISPILCLLLLLAGCVQDANVSKDNSDISDNTALKESTYVVNNFSDATMSIVEKTITSKGLRVEFTFSGDNEGQYGSWYTLEVNNDGRWYTLPYTYDGEGEITWTMEAYPVTKVEPRQVKVEWNWLYGELPNGHYRIIKNFSDFRGIGDYTEYYLSDEFIIK